MSNATAKALQDELDAIDYNGTLNKHLPDSEDFTFHGVESARINGDRIILLAPNFDGVMVETSFSVGSADYIHAIKDQHIKKLLRNPVGRPADVAGKKVNTYLDADSIAIASRLGNGNVSEGIRKALRLADNTKR